jgi:hypothetical protein
MRKNEEIRGKRLGQLKRSTGNAIPKQGLNGVIPDGLNYSRISVAVLMLSERESAIHFY